MIVRIIFGFKRAIKFFVSIFASREFAFLYCLIGTFVQIAHTYFLAESISALSGGFKIFQAVMLSVFISSSLLYFVAIVERPEDDATKRQRKEYRNNMITINIFMFIEIVINFYYYARHLVIDVEKSQIFDFIFAILVACLIPVTIKLYASHIRAKEWFDEFDKQNDASKPMDNDSTIDMKALKSTIDEAFQERQTIFLEQFGNKCKALMKDIAKNTLNQQPNQPKV
jgi:magnesium-transporting ATPase (P-type)